MPTGYNSQGNAYTAWRHQLEFGLFLPLREQQQNLPMHTFGCMHVHTLILALRLLTPLHHAVQLERFLLLRQ